VRDVGAASPEQQDGAARMIRRSLSGFAMFAPAIGIE
jgi:hypothetical protein